MGRENAEIDKLINNKMHVPYYFTTGMFWKAFFVKLTDTRSVLSLFNQAFHMLNPKFFGVQ